MKTMTNLANQICEYLLPSAKLTVKISFKVSESKWSIISFESDEVCDGFSIIITETFDQDVFICTTSTNLHAFQLQKLLKDATLDLVSRNKEKIEFTGQ